MTTELSFEPKIIAFLCNWCTYTGADLAGTSRLQYPPNVRIIRLMCSGAVDPIYVLKADLAGADGILIGGCHPGDCHYQEGNYKARRRVVAMKEILKNAGFEESAFGYVGLAPVKDSALQTPSAR
jgi:F420-non-reducing hydrogenase iron-sulfur subunit